MGSPPQWEEWSQRAPQPASCLFARVAPTPRPPHRLVNGSRQSRIRRNPSGSLQYEIIQEVLGYQWAKRGRGVVVSQLHSPLASKIPFLSLKNRQTDRQTLYSL